MKKIFTLEQSQEPDNTVKGSKYNTEKLCEKYSNYFERLRCLLHSVKIELRDDATPVVVPCRKIPFAQHSKLREELEWKPWGDREDPKVNRMGQFIRATSYKTKWKTSSLPRSTQFEQIKA